MNVNKIDDGTNDWVRYNHLTDTVETKDGTSIPAIRVYTAMCLADVLRISELRAEQRKQLAAKEKIMSDIKLPPLPETKRGMFALDGRPATPVYTAEQMREYASAAVQASVPDAQAEPLVLERLSEEEVSAFSRSMVKGGKSVNWLSEQIQSAIAAKNGAKLK